MWQAAEVVEDHARIAGRCQRRAHVSPRCRKFCPRSVENITVCGSSGALCGALCGCSRQPRSPASWSRAGYVGILDWWVRFLGPDSGPENGPNTKYTHSGCISCLSHFPALFLGRNPVPHFSCDVGVPGGAWCAWSVLLRRGCCCQHFFERRVGCTGGALQLHVPCHVLCVAGSLVGWCPSAWWARTTTGDMDRFVR